MRAISAIGFWFLLAVSPAGCNPEGDDAAGACNALGCVTGTCVAQGYPSGYCDSIGRCTCVGARDPSGGCTDSMCADACRALGGGTGGTCGVTGRCGCTGGRPDAGTDDGGDVWIPGSGSAHGVVMGPGAVFPVSGAVVYGLRSPTMPETIPEGNYCPRCLDLTGRPHTTSGPDGYFNLTGLSVGEWNLVVQKGQFRRVRTITIGADGEDVAVPTDYTTLPNRHDPANGDVIPKIAVALGSYDDMEDILAKVALATLTYDYHADLGDVANLTFDVYDNGDGGAGVPPFGDLITDPARMAQYQIIFVPCSNSWNDDFLLNEGVREIIRQWVAGGGKWYVADWSYDWVEQVFPEYLDFQGDDSTLGAADDASRRYDGRGRVVDPDLGAWLTAIRDDSADVTFQEIWDNIDSLGSVAAFDEDGNPITVVPKTWAEGNHEHPWSAGPYPYTVTFPYGCGRVLFTTYHTVGAMGGVSRPDLLIQEKILLYLVMEIGVCTDEVIIY